MSGVTGGRALERGAQEVIADRLAGEMTVLLAEHPDRDFAYLMVYERGESAGAWTQLEVAQSWDTSFVNQITHLNVACAMPTEGWQAPERQFLLERGFDLDEDFEQATKEVWQKTEIGEAFSPPPRSALILGNAELIAVLQAVYGVLDLDGLHAGLG